MKLILACMLILLVVFGLILISATIFSIAWLIWPVEKHLTAAITKKRLCERYGCLLDINRNYKQTGDRDG